MTGANGQVGRLVLRALVDMDAPRPVTLSRRSGADIVWTPDTGPCPPMPDCDAVLALWGVTSGDDAALARNSDLARQARRIALAAGASRVIHLSSAAVYGAGLGLRESDPARPVSAYGRAKLAMERTIAAFPRREGLCHCCLRVANVLGADSLTPALASGAPVVLDRFGDGRGPLRSYVSPASLARVLLALTRLPASRLPPLLNVASAPALRMETLVRAAGREVAWRPAPDGALAAVTLDASALNALMPALPPDGDVVALAGSQP
ncbi:SDR family oxidoreductase [Roseovarius sp. EGI FJ00037]|uniref:NAD-dependent epimerase/dehydratase family protein n=1 Tax=Roseovarius salincola TaxID=2978479 RepID=UPI0022A70B18|nr:SDR family oxidoreductase [Roseovarius sp. EGI FJ00037]MCZ0810907.1 SDR family oxidoreductase [Roseovarius sp. EGI FJ00037]